MKKSPSASFDSQDHLLVLPNLVKNVFYLNRDIGRKIPRLAVNTLQTQLLSRLGIKFAIRSEIPAKNVWAIIRNDSGSHGFLKMSVNETVVPLFTWAG